MAWRVWATLMLSQGLAFLCPCSEPTQCTMLYSRQGTTETIEEVEAEVEEEAVGTQMEEAKEEELEEEEKEEYGVGYGVEAEDASLTPEDEDEEEDDDDELPQVSTDDGEVEAPPSYSKAVTCEHLSFGSQDGIGAKNQMVVSPDDSRTDKLGSSLLPPLTHELTASELLLNK